MEREIIESLAKRWNLHRIPEVQDSLHWNFKEGVAHIGDPMGAWVRHPFTFFGGGQLVPWEFTLSFAGRYWIWSPTSTRSFKDFRCGVMRDLGVKRLRSLPPELRERFRELAKVASDFRRYLSDTPSALDSHVYWLFLRLCPQLERPLKISVIAEREWKDPAPRGPKGQQGSQTAGNRLTPPPKGAPTQSSRHLTSARPMAIAISPYACPIFFLTTGDRHDRRMATQDFPLAFLGLMPSA